MRRAATGGYGSFGWGARYVNNRRGGGARRGGGGTGSSGG